MIMCIFKAGVDVNTKAGRLRFHYSGLIDTFNAECGIGLPFQWGKEFGPSQLSLIDFKQHIRTSNAFGPPTKSHHTKLGTQSKG